jgi:RNA polymerase sigma factor (sigma-70 family)
MLQEQDRDYQDSRGQDARHGAGGPALRSTAGGTAACAGHHFWNEFARLRGRELERCVATAMRRVGWRPDPVEVDELVQEVYCRVLEPGSPAAPGSWPTAQLWGYLHRIARSVAVDALRTRAARKRGGCPAGERELRPCGVTALEERVAPGPDPEQQLLARERASALRCRVRELGGDEHGTRNVRILELSAIEGCTAAEVSIRLAGTITPSSVHTIIHRIRRQLAAPPRLAATLAMAGG